jgi:hypothetical protein
LLAGRLRLSSWYSVLPDFVFCVFQTGSHGIAGEESASAHILSRDIMGSGVSGCFFGFCRVFTDVIRHSSRFSWCFYLIVLPVRIQNIGYGADAKEYPEGLPRNHGVAEGLQALRPVFALGGGAGRFPGVLVGVDVDYLTS